MATPAVVRLVSGHTASPLAPGPQQELARLFLTEGSMVSLQPGGWLYRHNFIKFHEQIYNFKFQPDDVLVMTYPKCGTTWTQEILWTMRNNPDLDNPHAEDGLFVRSPFLEFDSIAPLEGPGFEAMKKEDTYQEFLKRCPGKDPKDGIMLQLAECLPSPRTLKTHLPFSLLRPSLLDHVKVVYVMRNPKDVLLSYQHHMTLLRSHSFVGDTDDFTKLFVEDKLMFGSYSTHLKEAWQVKSHPNLHLMFYEDMKEDIGSELARLDGFLGTGLSPQQLTNVAQRSSFGCMQARDPTKIMQSGVVDPAVAQRDGAFIRTGGAGTWRDRLTPHQVALMDRWFADNLQSTGITFKYQ